MSYINSLSSSKPPPEDKHLQTTLAKHWENHRQHSRNKYHHYHSVPCFIALATMDLHLSRFQVHEIVFVGLSFCNHTVTLSSIFSPCLPLLLFLSVFPVVTKCSNSFLLTTCPKNTACLFLASLTNDLLVPALSSTSSLLILSTY